MRGVIYDNDQRKINVHIIEDYTSNVLYFVDLDQHDCIKEDLELPFLRCVPGRKKSFLFPDTLPACSLVAPICYDASSSLHSDTCATHCF